MGKFSCLGIPAALFLLAADVSSMHDGDMIQLLDMSNGDSSSNFGPSTSLSPIMGKTTRASRCCSKGKRFARKWLKWILGIVTLLVIIVGLFLGIFLPRHSPPTGVVTSNTTGPTVSDTSTVAGWNTSQTVSDMVSNTEFSIATTTSDGGLGDSAFEQQMETFVLSEREKLAEYISLAKKNLLKGCLDLWSRGERDLYCRLVEQEIDVDETVAGKKFKKKLRKIAPVTEKWGCILDVESPPKSIENWVAAASTALEEYNNDVDELIKETRPKLLAANKELWRQAQLHQEYGQTTDKSKDNIIHNIGDTAGELTSLENKKAMAPRFVAEAIQRELGRKYPNLIEGNSVKGDIRMPSIKKLLEEMKVRKPINGRAEIERYEQKLLQTDLALWFGAKMEEKRKIELWNDPIVVRIHHIIEKLTKLEKQKQQEKKNN